MKMRFNVACHAALVIALLVCGGSARAGVIFNAENQPTSITDLQIGDATYRVDIEYGGSFDDHFGDFAAPSPLPLYWGSESGATDAVTAIAAALNAESPRPAAATMLIVSTGSGTWPFGDYVDAKIADFTVGASDYVHSTDFDGIRLDPHVPAGSFGWTTFRAVPEPSTLFSLSLSGLLLGAWKLRRRRVL